MVELCRENLFVLINYSFASIKDWKTKKKKKIETHIKPKV